MGPLSAARVPSMGVYPFTWGVMVVGIGLGDFAHTPSHAVGDPPLFHRRLLSGLPRISPHLSIEAARRCTAGRFIASQSRGPTSAREGACMAAERPLRVPRGTGSCPPIPRFSAPVAPCRKLHHLAGQGGSSCSQDPCVQSDGP